METIESVIAQYEGATLEQINDEIVMKGIEFGFLDILSSQYDDLTPILDANFLFDEVDHKYHIRPNNKFRSRIDLHLRIKYFLISFLRRREQLKEYPTFDEIVLHIMPLLKNGITPEHQTILKVLEEVAFRVGNDQWKLKDGQQMQLL
jgi:hypothetical protein